MIRQPSEKNDLTESHQEIFSEYYRNHRLEFTSLNGVCVGEVFKEEKLAYCEALDLDSARQYCRQIVDEALAQRVAKKNNAAPSLNELSSSLNSIQTQLNKAAKQLLREHIKQNNAPIESGHLKSIGGFKSTTDVMLAYANFARLLSDALCYAPPHKHSGQDAYLSMVIVSHEASNNELDTPMPNGLSISLATPIFKALQHIENF